MNRLTAVVASVALAAALAPSAHAQTMDEAAVLDRLRAMRGSNDPNKDGRWVQPANRTKKCQIYVAGPPDPATTHKWLGDCRNGKASGLGVIVSRSAQSGTSVFLEEYGIDGSEFVTYRQVEVSPQGTFIRKGHMTPGHQVVSGTGVIATAKGNRTVILVEESCHDGECTRRMADPLTGSMYYLLIGLSDYTISWTDRRADNQFLFTRRLLSIEGTLPFVKDIFDGEVYDIYSDTRSGQRGRVVFTDAVNAALELPLKQFSDIRNDVQMAVQESDAKFASAYERFCRGQKDRDIRRLCDPSELIPKEEELAAARAELNEAGRTFYEQLRSSAATAKAQAQQMQAQQMQAQQMQAQQMQAQQMQAQQMQAQQMQAQQMQAQQMQQQLLQQQALAAEQQRQDLETLNRSLESLNQAGLNAQRLGQQMRQSYGVPQFQAPTLNKPSIIHCRTIGSFTFCN